MRQDTSRRLQELPKSPPEPSKRRPTGLQDLPSGLPGRGRRQEGVSPLNPATEPTFIVGDGVGRREA